MGRRRQPRWGCPPDVGAGREPYNGGMTSIDTPSSSSTPQVSVAEAFLGFLAAGDFDRFGAVLDPDVSLTALLPAGLREWHGRDQVSRAFVGWFGRADEYELLEASVGQVGPRLQLGWCARVRGGPYGDASFVVEQHAYADTGPSGRIRAMSMLCSGFAREHLDD